MNHPKPTTHAYRFAQRERSAAAWRRIAWVGFLAAGVLILGRMLVAA